MSWRLQISALMEAQSGAVFTAQQMSERTELLEQIKTARESNTFLRGENARLTDVAARAEREAARMAQEVGPLNERVR